MRSKSAQRYELVVESGELKVESLCLMKYLVVFLESLTISSVVERSRNADNMTEMRWRFDKLNDHHPQKALPFLAEKEKLKYLPFSPS